VGPFSPSKIKQMISDGKIKGTDLLRVEGDSDWIPAAEIPALRDLMQATEEAWVADDDAYDEVEYQASPRGVTEASEPVARKTSGDFPWGLVLGIGGTIAGLCVLVGLGIFLFGHLDLSLTAEEEVPESVDFTDSGRTLRYIASLPEYAALLEAKGSGNPVRQQSAAEELAKRLAAISGTVTWKGKVAKLQKRFITIEDYLYSPGPDDGILVLWNVTLLNKELIESRSEGSFYLADFNKLVAPLKRRDSFPVSARINKIHVYPNRSSYSEITGEQTGPLDNPVTRRSFGEFKSKQFDRRLERARLMTGMKIGKGMDCGIVEIELAPNKEGAGSRLADSAVATPSSTAREAAEQSVAQSVRTLKGAGKTESFSPDGKRIVSGSGDKTVKVWDAQTGQEMFTIKGHSEGVSSVSFSPDGKRIVSGSYDKTVKVWDISSLDTSK